MAEWRFGRGWTEQELAARLQSARGSQRNFVGSEADMTPEHGWSRHYSKAVVAREAPGPPEPGGAFESAWPLMEGYAFSDPRIVKGHFDVKDPILGRVLLIEARVFGLHFLGSAVVSALRNDADEQRTVKGFRYDTLEGHFERGLEWFLLTKDHASGDITLTVHAGWKEGDLPNWWSRLGFRLLVRRYQRAWHRLAHLRMRALLESEGLEPLPRGARLVHSGPPLPFADVQAATSGTPPEPVVVEQEQIVSPIAEAS